MKYFTNFKDKFIGILFIFIILITANILNAKTLNVNVSNTKFTPKDITINVGDTVKWTNTQGNHNVNGSQSEYPNNPESFGNSVAGPGWVYTHVFTLAGKYDYQCDPHINFGMVGSVTVETTSDVQVEDLTGKKSLNIYPNPGTDYIIIESGNSTSDYEILISDIIGNTLLKHTNISSPIMYIDTHTFEKGIYFIKVQCNANTSQYGSFIIK
ncbi:MAG: T9SS type A sorting domain-containing protein [Ignavibacteriae bacterium]|nr:T9SS type A sorting domain-containing protein [Ignavibacteriota bacterium]